MRLCKHNWESRETTRILFAAYKSPEYEQLAYEFAVERLISIGYPKVCVCMCVCVRCKCFMRSVNTCRSWLTVNTTPRSQSGKRRRGKHNLAKNKKCPAPFLEFL